jgi:hypothetical protein
MLQLQTGQQSLVLPKSVSPCIDPLIVICASKAVSMALLCNSCVPFTKEVQNQLTEMFSICKIFAQGLKTSWMLLMQLNQGCTVSKSLLSYKLHVYYSILGMACIPYSLIKRGIFCFMTLKWNQVPTTYPNSDYHRGSCFL